MLHPVVFAWKQITFYWYMTCFRYHVIYQWLVANSAVSFISQGMALSLGDKINLSQKKANIWGHSPPADLSDFSHLLPVSLRLFNCCQVRTHCFFFCFFLNSSPLSELYISVTFSPCPVKFSVKKYIKRLRKLWLCDIHYVKSSLCCNLQLQWYILISQWDEDRLVMVLLHILIATF